MYEIFERIKSYNYKKMIFPVILIFMYVLGFIYLDDKINKKEITKIENIIYEEENNEEEEEQKEEILNISTHILYKNEVSKLTTEIKKIPVIQSRIMGIFASVGWVFWQEIDNSRTLRQTFASVKARNECCH